MVKISVLFQLCAVAAVTLTASAAALGLEDDDALAVDSDGPLTAQDFWANRGKRDYTRQKMWVRPNSMMTTYSAPSPGKRGAVLRPNSLLNTYSPKFDKRVFVVRPNSLLTTYSAPQGKRGAALRPNSLLNAYGMKGKRGLSLRPNSLLNTYQGKRAFRPPLQRFNDIEERMIGKRGGRVRFNLRSMRPNSFMNVYSTAGQKQRRSDPSLIHFEEGEYDGGVADNVVEEEFEEPNQIMQKRDDAEAVEEELEGDDQKRDAVEEGEGEEGLMLGPRLYREFWSSRGKKNAAGGTNFFAVRG